MPGEPRLVLDPSVRGFPGLDAVLARVDGISVSATNPALERFKEEILARVRATHDLATLKDMPELRAYRDFFWRVGIDSTKVRPAAEALLRRILQGKALPSINTLVDAYNIASVATRIALAAFDTGKLQGDVVMRMAHAGEPFLGIGMDRPLRLTGREVVNADAKALIAVYGYRDAAQTKLTHDTTSVVLMACGVPGIPRWTVEEAARTAAEIVSRFCGRG